MTHHDTLELKESPTYWSVVSDILSQAITGELIGMLNYSSIATMSHNPREILHAVENANSERGHALAFMSAAEKHDLNVIVNPQANYWNSVRRTFLDWVGQNDLVACVLIQDFMLEGFAISMYSQIGKAINGSIGELFTKTAQQEESHLEASIEFLLDERDKDPPAFEIKVQRVHEGAMPALAEMVSCEDHHGHCDLCGSSCVKESLPLAGLDIGTLRGCALNYYLKSLDRLGLPGYQTLGWVASLPV